MQIKVDEKRTVEAKTLEIHCKVRDCFDARLVAADGAILKDYEGYVPDFMPGRHYGDYLILNIDIETGQVTNWETPTTSQMEDFVNGGES
jgi:hypothetical protein